MLNNSKCLEKSKSNIDLNENAFKIPLERGKQPKQSSIIHYEQRYNFKDTKFSSFLQLNEYHKNQRNLKQNLSFIEQEKKDNLTINDKYDTRIELDSNSSTDNLDYKYKGLSIFNKDTIKNKSPKCEELASLINKQVRKRNFLYQYESNVSNISEISRTKSEYSLNITSKAMKKMQERRSKYIPIYCFTNAKPKQKYVHSQQKDSESKVVIIKGSKFGMENKN